METADHIKHIETLISLSTMTKEEKEVISKAFKDFIYHEMKKGGKNV